MGSPLLPLPAVLALFPIDHHQKTESELASCCCVSTCWSLDQFTGQHYTRARPGHLMLTVQQLERTPAEVACVRATDPPSWSWPRLVSHSRLENLRWRRYHPSIHFFFVNYPSIHLCLNQTAQSINRCCPRPIRSGPLLPKRKASYRCGCQLCHDRSTAMNKVLHTRDDKS